MSLAVGSDRVVLTSGLNLETPEGHVYFKRGEILPEEHYIRHRSILTGIHFSGRNVIEHDGIRIVVDNGPLSSYKPVYRSFKSMMWLGFKVSLFFGITYYLFALVQRD